MFGEFCGSWTSQSEVIILSKKNDAYLNSAVVFGRYILMLLCVWKIAVDFSAAPGLAYISFKAADLHWISAKCKAAK